MNNNSPQNKSFKKYTKNAFILYLALITGCTNTVQNIETASVNESSNSINSKNQKNDNKYNLPSLDIKTKKEGVNKNSSIERYLSDNTEQDPFLKSTDASKKIKTQDGSDLETMAIGKASSAVSDTVENWFSIKHTTAKLDISADDKGVKTGSFDILVPLFDSKDDLVFTQLGFRRSNKLTEDYRNTVNLGLGYRHTIDKWMLGVNSFYDKDITGKNERLGLGAEAWTDFLKLSGNSYIRLSDWKQSTDMEFYQERPANGWDLRAEAYLPQYPQLGGKLMYEQYYGDEVGLFSASSRQKDPSATTIGISYSPIPLISLGTDYRQGQNGLSETSFKVGFNLQLGVPLKKQLSADEVRSSRLISNARYNLVNRNNEIVLDYKQDPLGTITLPSSITGNANSSISFPVNLTGNISNITWTGTASSYATTYGGGATASITVPAYSNINNSYFLKAIGTDRSGRVVESNVMQINVETVKITVESSKPTTSADGNDSATFTATLTKNNGEVLPNNDVEWNVSGSATIISQETKTNTLGKARIKLISHAASLVTVTASEPTGATAMAETSFVSDQTQAKVTSITSSSNTVIANGINSTTLTAVVQDGSGNSIGPNVTVNWSTTLGNLSSPTSITGNDGKAIITLKSITTGSAIITANTAKGSSSTTVNFTPDNSTLNVTSLTSQYPSVIADNVSTSTLTAIVKDSNGNIAPAGISVNWTSSIGTLLSASTVTDANGKTTNTIKSSDIGSSTILAKTNSGAGANIIINFTSNNANATVVNVISSPAQVVADGVTKSILTATVQDGNGHPVGANIPVTWTTTIGTLTSSTTVTDANGIATNSISGNVVSNANIIATSAKGSSNISVEFISNGSTATIASISPKTSTIIANNTDATTFTVIVKNENGDIAPLNTPISWSTSNNNGTLSANSSMTNASGEATITFKGTIAGQTIITATAAKNSETATVTLNPDNAHLILNINSVSPTSIVANSIEKSTINVTLSDINNNPISNATINWSDSLGNSISATTTTDNNGHSTNNVFGNISGNDLITITSGSISKTTTIILTQSKQLVKNGSIVATPANIPADKTTTSTITALIVDENNNPVSSGINVNWSLDNTLATLSNSTSVTDSSGKVTNTIVSSGTVSGTTNITISAKDSNGSIPVIIEASTITPSVYSVNSSLSSLPADGVKTTVLTAIIHDQNGNPVPANTAVSWTTTLGTLATTNNVTDANGIATNTLSSTVTGNATVTATSGNSSKSSDPIYLTSNSFKLDKLSASKDTILADNMDTSVITATVKDSNGNPAGAGITVYWYDDNSEKVYTTTTASNGTSSISVKTYHSYGVYIYASITSADSEDGEEIEISTTPANDYKISSFKKSKDTIEADGIDFSTLSVSVVDKDGNLVGAGIPVLWLDKDITYTDSSGIAQYSISSNFVGTNAISYQLPNSSNDQRFFDSVNSVNSKKSNENYVISLSSDRETLNNNQVATLTAILKDKITNQVIPDKYISIVCDGASCSGLNTTSVISNNSFEFTSPSVNYGESISIRAIYKEDGNDLYDSVSIIFTGIDEQTDCSSDCNGNEL